LRRTSLLEHEFTSGLQVPFNPLAGGKGLADGSRNLLRLPGGFQVWKGLSSFGANTGSRLMRNVGGTWGGLKDIGSLQAKGSLFQDIGRSLWFIGAGQVSIEGADLVGITASTSLKVSLSVNGAYSAATTYVAGLPQPSAPDIGIPASIGTGLTGNIKGPVSTKIARLRLSTGARSVSSPTSAVADPQNQTVRVTFPLPSTGQDYWAVFFTQSGFGGVGLHYRAPFNGALDIPESLVAASSVDGIPRSLEFDFKDGDLIPEVAYIDDYVPPAGTHAVRLENVMVVLGAYADSTSPVSSTNPGTVGAVSLPNYYESYKPRHLVYFPEQIVDVMARPTDQFAYVGHRDCITALQYVGVQDGPAVAVTMVSPDIGIAKPHNWCQVHGLLYVFPAQGGPVRMRRDGSWDYTFAADVRALMKDWSVEETIVGWHPDTLSVVYMNNGQGLSFSLQTEEWSAICNFTDGGVSGTALSCTSTAGQLVVSIIDPNGTHIAYAWHEGATSMPISVFTQWQKSLRPITVMELSAGFEADRSSPLLYSVHRNLKIKYVVDGRVTGGHHTLESIDAKWAASITGDMVLIFGAGIGVGVDYLIARVTYGSPTVVMLSDPITGATLNTLTTAQDCFVVIATQIGSYVVSQTGYQHTPPLQDVFVDECQSFAIGLHQLTMAVSAGFSHVNVQGTGQMTPTALST